MLRKPVVVILGSTGTGKTKLSLDLAKKFGGEIISADSMQVYTGLDIVTAKATKTEQSQAPHHLLDVAKPGVSYSVKIFQQSALPIVENLLAAQKMPIIVGGTNYYIESLLWKILIDEHQLEDDGDGNPKRIKLSEERMFDGQDMRDIDSTILHEKLKLVDPESATKLHPNNKRKIIRALEVFQNSGKLISEFIKDQKEESGGSAYGGPLRFENLVLFWLTCDQEVLNQRLDKRVDGMVEQGLLTEIRGFHKNFIKPFDDQPDYTKGILQTIGFKEFVPYLEKYDEDEDSKITDFMKNNTEGVDPPESMKTLNECLDQLKLVTRRYSKKQTKWVKNRFLKANQKNRQIPPIYRLDTSKPELWDDLVLNPALNVIDNTMDKTVELVVNPEPQTITEVWNEDVSNFCETCQKIFVGEFQWKIHMKSHRHKKALERKHKIEKLGTNLCK